VSLRIVCSSGTYIRTLADDIARALGGRAHLTKLRRTRIGALGVDRASSVGTLVEAIDDGSLDRLTIAPSDALASFDEVLVDEPTSFRVRNGRPLPAETAAGEVGDLVRVCADDSGLIAVYRRGPDAWKPEVVIA
jgi:tRNA pseudouridine55 synthase